MLKRSREGHFPPESANQKSQELGKNLAIGSIEKSDSGTKIGLKGRELVKVMPQNDSIKPMAPGAEVISVQYQSSRVSKSKIPTPEEAQPLAESKGGENWTVTWPKSIDL